MAGKLDGKKICFVVCDGFEQVELTGPKEGLEKEGATCHIVSPNKDKVKGFKHTEWGDSFAVDVPLDQAKADDYDALVLPGGVMNPDKLRIIPKATQLVRDFIEAGKTVAAICHGPWTLINAEVVEDRTMTSWPTLQVDLENAGADWVDEEVVVDDGVVTSRKPDDIPAFTAKIIEEMLEPLHGKARARAGAPAGAGAGQPGPGAGAPQSR